MYAVLISLLLYGASILIVLYKIFPYFIELGELRKERETMIVPELKHLRRENESLIRDIEKIMEGDEYVKGVWRDIIKQRKSRTRIQELFKTNKQ